MIYHFKQPLMIVGLILSIPLGLNTFAADEVTPEPEQISTPTPQINAQPNEAVEQQANNSLESNTPTSLPAETNLESSSPKKVEGLALPENAQSTIIPSSKATDVRVIIDISGSMKQNDPDNLRIPALNLIVEMIPEGARAGVWTFGQWVNMLIPPATVDEQWRENAKENAKKINSHGLRTNIGQAMEKAIWQFEKDGQYEQHTILLTDGLVDIVPDSDPQQQAKNDAERQRIATEVLKQYQALGVKVHSIGLSDNADKVLLDKLALETGGTSVVVNTAEELVKAFLKAFEKAAPEVAEQVPLSKDNTFDIDASVEEFTALVFREKGSMPMQLTSPSGIVISQIKIAENARWFGESVYDLVTISKPEAGQWKIEAKLDPDNRVTVISDLKMDIKNLPNALFPGQQVNFEMFLHEDGKIINDQDFLKLMTIEMTMTAESGRSGTKVISDPENIPADGRYKESISRLSKEGQYELKIEVDGKTFKRMRKEYIQVRQPIGFEIRKVQQGETQVYAVRVIPQVADVEVAKTRVIAKLKGPDQSSIIQAMPWLEEGVWEAIIDPAKGPGDYVIAMNIKGSIGQNQEFRVKPDPITLTFPIPDDFTHEYLAESQQEDVPEEKDVESEKVTEPEPDATKEEQVEAVEETPAEPVMPDLEEKMQKQTEETTAETATEDEAEEEVLEPIPYWLYAAIPITILLLGVGGFLVYRKVMNKKLAVPAEEKTSNDSKSADVNLNDGLDDEDFDEDFDLSGDDDDEMDINVSDNDDTSVSEPEPEPEAEETPPADPVEDDIPDFDENFDVENTPDEDPIEGDTASAIDELDSVLDGLSDEDEGNIPQLDEAIEEIVDEVTDTEDIDIASEEFDLGASASEPDDSPDEEDDNSIDAALANLESELDDIDVDALIDEDKKEP